MSLYLVPASRVNLAQTIERPAPIDVLTGHLDARLLRELLIATDAPGLFCWAMTETLLRTFQAMKPGDDVLFSESGTGAFTHYGQVVGKTHNRALGDALWPFVKDKPWELIYFLRGIRRIKIPKKSMVVALGYSPKDNVAGSRRVSPERLKAYEQRNGTLCESLQIRVHRDDLLPVGENPTEPPRDYSSEDILSVGKRRRAHQAWARQVKSNYGFQCAVSGIREREFLVAGHIVPWSVEKESRLDPGNGICLSVFYDRAFERGYFTLASDLRIDVSSQVERQSPLGQRLWPLQGKAIRLPQYHPPTEQYLRYHRSSACFRG